MKKVKICTCKECKAAKVKKSTNVRRFFKRLTNKKIRQAKEGEAINFYWS